VIPCQETKESVKITHNRKRVILSQTQNNAFVIVNRITELTVQLFNNLVINR